MRALRSVHESPILLEFAVASAIGVNRPAIVCGLARRAPKAAHPTAASVVAKSAPAPVRPVGAVRRTIHRGDGVQDPPGRASALFPQSGLAAAVGSGVSVHNRYCVPPINAETGRSP